MRKTRWVSLVVVLAAAAALAGCQKDEDTAAPAAPASATPASSADGASRAFNLLSGTAKTNGAPAGTGDWTMMKGGTPTSEQLDVAERWVQLTARLVGSLGGGVVNGAGLTVYRFDKDSAEPSKATCNDDCAQKWPPLTVDDNGKVFIAGIKKSDIGFVRRDDGRLQVTVGKWPVYRFAQDTQPGDTLGQGVGGTWFAVTPDGGKVTDGQQPPSSEQPQAGGQPQPGADDSVPPATSAFLFSEKNFSDTAATQGVTGGECKDVSLTVKSISADGRFFVWSQPGCQGDRREFGDEGVTDLGSFSTKSIRLR